MSENKRANYVSSFYNWAMGTMSESCYNNPHQEWCVGKMRGAKMLHCKHEGCKVRVHSICQIDWLKQHCLEVNRDDPIFADSTTSVTRIMFNLGQGNIKRKESRCMLGSFSMPKKSLKSINDAPACYSYHNSTTLFCSEPRLW
jgi:hypothetical protein